MKVNINTCFDLACHHIFICLICIQYLAVYVYQCSFHQCLCVYVCEGYKGLYMFFFFQASGNVHSLLLTQEVIHTFSLFPPSASPPKLRWEQLCGNGSMSVSSHVQTEVACGQPHFINANKKRRSKKVIKTLLTSDNCLSQEDFSFQRPVY